MRQCKCGCGGEVVSKNPRTEFLQGHHTIWVARQGTPQRKRYEPRADEIPSGWCECGCGKRTGIVPIGSHLYRKQRHFPGHPYPRLVGHGRQETEAAHRNWRGGRIITVKGYIVVYAPGHPAAQKGYVLEHRLVIESVLGRRLEASEDVHHKNGDKQDNRPENLEVLSHSEHMRNHRAEERAAGIVRPQTSRRGIKHRKPRMRREITHC